MRGQALAARSLDALITRLFGGWVRRVDATSLRADLIAGVLGALLVLPQGFAFATLAGLPPAYGLYTAIVPCIVAALFGSSWHVVSGPTNANSLALFATLAPLAVVGSPEYVGLALAVTVLVGLMQFTIATLRLGSLANFISPAALRGFMAGAAALIALYSLPDLFGFPAPSAHRLGALAQHLLAHASEVRPASLAIGLLTIAVALGARRLRPHWPFMLIGIVAATAVAFAFNRWWPAAGAARVAVVGEIPPIWPHFKLPEIDVGTLPDLVGIAFALTIVALGQSISIAKAVADRSGQQIDANREFRGQGLSNIVGGFFSSYVSCGSLNRSIPNLDAGARTPLAAVFAALWLLLLLALSSSLLALIPMPAIAALLLLISWSLFDLPSWQRLFRFSRQDFAVASATFAATISIRLEVAILLGTILSLVTYVYRTSKPAMRVMGFDSVEPARPFVVRADATAAMPECPQLKMIRMEGEVYFGAVSHVSDQLRDLRAPAHSPKHLLVMAKSMNFIDLAAAEMWRAELTTRRAAGGDLWFHRPRAPVLALWQRVGFMAELGTDHIFPAKRIAISTIFDRLDRAICAHCTIRLYEECKALPLPMDGGASDVSPGSRAVVLPTATSAAVPARGR
ncbi:MAG: SulP family inorganic anion transporter [Caldimonas sp.]